MKLLLLLLLLLAFPIIGFGQNVNIPDANFKAWLVGNTAINTNADNEIQVNEAAAFTGFINVPNSGIINLTGIGAFTALSYLNCYSNQLTSLDISNNTALTTLNCFGNQLTSLDVSANTALDGLYCANNNLTSLDVSTCTVLTRLYCYSNQLISLNVKNGNNINMDEFENPVDGSYQQAFLAYNNPNLSCIEVDNVAWSQENWWYISEWGNPQIDATASFSLNCSGAGFSDINESNTLMIYPNPTNGDFTITGLELVGTVSSLTLTDMNGKVVKVLDPKVSKFSMASIKPGVYFLNILSGNKQEVLKIVKE